MRKESATRRGAGGSSGTRIVLSVVIAVACAAEASALEFDAGHLLYAEDFGGETSYPTEPERDVQGVGGLTGAAAGPGGPVFGDTGPLLTGQVARAQVFGAETKSVEYVARSFGSGGDQSHGQRILFQGLAVTGDGTSRVGVTTSFNAPSPSVEIVSQIEIVTAGAITTVAFQLIVLDAGVETELASSPLLGPEGNAIVAGDPFTIDVFVDREAERALASLRVDGFAEAARLDVDASALGTRTAGFTLAYGAYEIGAGPVEVRIDIDRVEAYSALPRAYNIDLGTSQGAPAATYAAAGEAGFWNSVGIGVSALVDTHGVPTAATVDVDAAFDFAAFPTPDPNLTSLVADHLRETSGSPQTWSVELENLVPGRYRVFYYAPSYSLDTTGDLVFEGAPRPSLPGEEGLTRGVAWDRIALVSEDGTLSIAGSRSSILPSGAGLAGLQLEPLPPAKVPSGGPSALVWLAGLLALFGARAAGHRPGP